MYNDTVNIELNSDIGIIWENHSFCRLVCKNEGTYQEIFDRYSYEVPNSRFMKRYKSSKWDGKIRLYNIHTKRFPVGLLYSLEEFAKNNNYSIQKFNFEKFIRSEYNTENICAISKKLNLHSNNKSIELMDHQIKGISYALTNRRSLLLSPTASGKSLILYFCMRVLLAENPNSKILFIVPSTSLVEQIYSDFQDYSSKNKWDVEKYIHRIYEGKNKESSKKIYVSTWQSIYEMPSSYFEKFTAIFVDEAHGMKAQCLKKIMEKSIHAEFRLGVTGTLDGVEVNKLLGESLTGSVYKVTASKDLMNIGILSPLEIKCILFKYTVDERNYCKQMIFADELNYLVNHERRTNKIIKFATSLKFNTLILTRFVNHGKKIYEELIKKNPGRPIYFIDSSTPIEQREYIRKNLDFQQNAIIVASYQIFSTGINIRSLTNIIFASPCKGKNRVLQSIGRQLRKFPGKNKAYLFDIGDDLSSKSWDNYGLKHMIERISIYSQEEFQYKIHPMEI